MAQRLLTLGAAALRLRLPGYALAFPNFLQNLTNATTSYVGNTFTLETLVKVNAFANPPGYGSGNLAQYIFLCSGSESYAFSLLFLASGKIRFRNYKNGVDYETGSGVVKVGGWFHLAFVHDYENLVMRFYINAVQVYQTDIVMTIRPNTAFSIGNVDSDRSNSNLFGELDEFRMWKTARTAQQISDNYRRPNAALIADGQITPATTAFCHDFDTPVPVASPVFTDGSGNGVSLSSSYAALRAAQTGPCPLLTGYPTTTPRKILTLTTA
ncbi:LamG domain-containing protein [Hymenobacter sp. ASUV-10]|uniref:LamG domain-containing protein n=1 Tax=Hymenobacter aranciens TaxID=3063996 RepID=A0ABT9BHW1_9BACT|nr:LamG domain-containing protein [Hymenobacter sp. ASUV-10]MDO7877390.1 LamG domain-containing protein [Hymenobacter sp. ASUV-10]